MNIWYKIFIFFPVWILFSGIFYGVVLIIFPQLFNATGSEFELLFATNKVILMSSQIAILLGTFVSILFVSKVINKAPPDFLKSMFNSTGLLYGIVVGVLLISLCVVLLSFFIPVKIKYQGFLDIGLLFYLVLFVVVALSEEILSRGYVFSNLFANINGFLAILISSLIFALMHILNNSITILGFINLILAGILFTLLYLLKMNLSVPIGIHFSWNFLLGPILGFSVSGFPTESVFKIEAVNGIDFPFHDFGLEGSYYLTIIIIPFIFYFFYRNLGKVLKKAENIPD